MFEEEDDEIKKIPYDSEPIARGHRFVASGARDKKTTSRRSSPKILTAIVSICCVLIIVMGAGLYFVLQQINEIKGNKSSYNLNITGDQVDLSYASAKGMSSTVCVSASTSNNCADATSFFSSNMNSRGSGIVLDIDTSSGTAYIMTNYHVVARDTQNDIHYQYIWIMFWDSLEPVAVSYVGGNASYDIAVLSVTNSDIVKNTKSNKVEVSNSCAISVGEGCVAIGNSMARNLRITTGVISVEEDIFTQGNEYNFYISHSADVNSGNSGGGLFNSKGQLIGVVNAKYTDVYESTGTMIYGEVIHGMNYAIPSSIAFSVANNLLRNTTSGLQKPNIGFEFGVNYEYAEKYYGFDETTNYLQTKYRMVVTDNFGDFREGDILKSMTYTYNGAEIVAEIDHIFSIESNVYNIGKNQNVVFVVERGLADVEITVQVTSTSRVTKAG